MKRKILSLILVFAMTVSLLTVGTGAVGPTYGDTAGHWAESSIERWSAYGIIQGSNGQFDPNGQLTCAQLATILAKLLKLPAAKDAGFTDNTADAWYYDAINRCAAAGILNGNGDGTVTPEAPITRERAMVMLARALGIEPIRKPDLTKYTDAAQVSAYAQGYVAALIEAGIVGGVTADELAPQDNINRASTVTILDRAIGTYADKAGATVKADGKGIVLVVAENVKITGAPEGTKIVVADGATGLTVNGKSVSDDQTYIVPKTEPTKPSGSSSGGYSHSHSYVYTDNGDGTHTGRCYANDSTLVPEAHNHDGENGACSICGAKQTTESVASVKAADGTCNYYSTLPRAVAAAADGATITLLNEQELSANLVFSTKVTLNLNGQAVETKGYAIQVQGSGDLTVTGNGTVNNDQEAVEVNNKKNYHTIFSVEGETAKLTIENGTFTTKASQAIFAEGTVTIHDGTFQNTAESVNGALDSSAMITAKGRTANMIIHKASVFATAESGNNGIYGIYGANGAHITLGDDVEVHTSFAAIGMNNTTSDPEVVITVNGGTYKSECRQLDNNKHSKFNAVCYLPGKCQMTINGGTFIAGTDKMHVFSIPYAQAGMNLTIKDGTFTAGSNVFYSKNDDHKNQTTDNKIVVSGGSFTGTIACFDENNTFSNFITGGTFSSDPSEYVAEGYIALVNNDDRTFTVSNTNKIPVTTATVQDYLDGKYGSINDKTLMLAGGDYAKIKFGRATAYKGSNTEYYLSGTKSTPDAIKQNINEHPNGAGKREYVRSMSNVTLKAADGAAVTINGLVAFGGQVNSTEWYSRDFVADRDMSAEVNNNISYWIGQNWSNITFEGLTFTDGVNINAYGDGVETNINNVNFTGCKFNVSDTDTNKTNCIRLNVDGKVAKANNLVVENCEFTDGFTAVLTDGMPNVTVTGSTFSGLTKHAINPMMNWDGAPGYGEITVTGNTFKNMSSETEDNKPAGTILRMGDVGAGAVFTIQKNTATEDITLAKSIKVNSLADGIKYNISGNNWGSLTASDPKLDDNSKTTIAMGN